MPWITRLLTTLIAPLTMLAEAAADGLPSWEKIFGATGLSAWAFMAGLFISDKVRTTAGAQREIDGWKEVARLAKADADKWQERCDQAMKLAADAVKRAENANRKPEA